MRVLLTIHDFLPQARAGSELYTYYLAQALQKSGSHQVHILHCEQHNGFEVERRTYDGLDCTVIRKPVYETDRLPNEDDERVDQVFNDLQTAFKPDVLHINHLIGLSTRIPRLTRERGTPVIFTVHDFWLACLRISMQQPTGLLCESSNPRKCGECCRNRYSRFPDWTLAASAEPKRFKGHVKDMLFNAFELGSGSHWFDARRARVAEIVQSANLFVMPSRFLQDRLCGEGIPRAKTVYCDYGMPDDVMRRAAPSPQLRKDRVRFGFVGTISEHKGVDVLLKAFDGFDRADLRIYGRANPSLLDRFQHVLDQPNVEFRGVLNDENKAVAFSELDALIVPSVWYENSPLTIHEAFLAGIPVITSNIGGMAELVPHEVCGMQFDVGNHEDLRRRLEQVVDQPDCLEAYRRRIPHVKTMDEHVPEIVGFYERELAATASPNSSRS
jgi:glycosyltransferase involved in cell wall biosynthesis